MNLYVFDLNLNVLGVVDDYIKLEVENHYRKMSEMSLQIDGSAENINLLKKGRVIAKESDLEHGFLILHREYIDEKSSELKIMAYSTNILLNRRIILGQQEFTGNVEDVMKSFISINAISPTNTKRKLNNLILAQNTNININTSESTSDTHLDDFLYEVSNKHDISWDVLIDVINKKYVVKTWQGKDRSAQQSVNPQIIFSKEFDNVLRQNYLESDIDYKTTVIIAGEGEGIDRKRIVVNDNFSGYGRYEMFVDARDLQSKYTNESNQEVTLTPEQYTNLLTERGKAKLAEYQKITTFESDIDLYSNNVYGIDYHMGDIVSVKNSDLNIIMHARIISAFETYNRAGTTLKIDFGNNIPTFLDKIKRAVK